MPRKFSLALFSLLLVAGLAHGAGFERDFSFAAQRLEVRDLIGAITVEPATGDQWEVHVAVRGQDADPDRIDVVLSEGRDARLVVMFPEEQHDYVYPPLGEGKVSFSGFDGTEVEGFWNTVAHIFRNGFGSDRINVRAAGKGLEAWADITVRVPAGGEAAIYLGAGRLASADVRGDLRLDTHAAPVEVTGHTGPLVCDTGSAGVAVTGAVGDLLVDTGSGSVRVADHRGGTLTVDTGSGGVRIEGAETPHLLVDTGSGGVTAHAVVADVVEIDTGSGGVELDLVRLAGGEHVIDTGSGSVRVQLPADASATIAVDTGSGGIEHAMPGGVVVREGRGELELRVGGGEARMLIDTGSGSVTVAPR